MSADPVRDLWDAVSSANVRAIADQLYPPNLHVYGNEPAADVQADVLVSHRDLDEAMRERLKHERDSEPREESLRDYERREFD